MPHKNTKTPTNKFKEKSEQAVQYLIVQNATNGG